MPSPSPSPTSTTSSHSRTSSRDTGFPEYMDGVRNTTLPHPSANVGPNATISQHDVSFDFVGSRRQTLLLKHRRTISSGTMSPIAEALRTTVPVSSMADLTNSPVKVTETASTPSTTQAGSQSFESKRLDDDSVPSSPDLTEESSGRRSLFGKWKKRGI